MGNLSCEILLSCYVDSYAGTLFLYLIEAEQLHPIEVQIDILANKGQGKITRLSLMPSVGKVSFLDVRVYIVI